MKETNSALFVREWVIVYVFLFLLCTFSALSFAKKHSLIAPETYIQVKVVGAVHQEKTLKLAALSTVADILANVQPLDDADLDKLIIDERLKAGIFILPKKHFTSVYVEGAVQKSGVYYVPENCRFNELLSYIPLTQEADLRYFTRKRRLVCEGEMLYVPKLQKFVVKKAAI